MSWIVFNTEREIKMNYGKDEPYSNYEPHKEYESKKLKKQKFYEDNFYKILTGDDDDDNRPPQ